MVFTNAHLTMNHQNKVAVIAAHTNQRYVIVEMLAAYTLIEKELATHKKFLESFNSKT